MAESGRESFHLTRPSLTHFILTAILTNNLPEVKVGLEEKVERQSRVGERSRLQRFLQKVRALHIGGRGSPLVGLQVLQQSHHLHSNSRT